MDADQTHKCASDLGLHCLLRPVCPLQTLRINTVPTETLLLCCATFVVIKIIRRKAQYKKKNKKKTRQRYQSKVILHITNVGNEVIAGGKTSYKVYNSSS